MLHHQCDQCLILRTFLSNYIELQGYNLYGEFQTTQYAFMTTSSNFVTSTPTQNPFWFLDNGATNHVVVNNDNQLEQIEYQKNNKLVVYNEQNLDVIHFSNTLVSSFSTFIKLSNMQIV